MIFLLCFVVATETQHLQQYNGSFVLIGKESRCIFPSPLMEVFVVSLEFLRYSSATLSLLIPQCLPFCFIFHGSAGNRSSYFLLFHFSRSVQSRMTTVSFQRAPLIPLTTICLIKKKYDLWTFSFTASRRGEKQAELLMFHGARTRQKYSTHDWLFFLHIFFTGGQVQPQWRWTTFCFPRSAGRAPPAAWFCSTCSREKHKKEKNNNPDM